MRNSKFAIKLNLNLDNTVKMEDTSLGTLDSKTGRNETHKRNLSTHGENKVTAILANQTPSNQYSSISKLEEKGRIGHKHTFSKESLQIKTNEPASLKDMSLSNIYGLSTTTRLYLEQGSVDSKISGITLPSIKNLYTDTDRTQYTDRGELELKNNSYMNYSRSVKLLDSVERRKLPLSKEIFYSKDQIELNKKFHQGLNLDQKAKESPIRPLKENKTETIDVYDKKKIYYKVYCKDKIFPAFVNIHIDSGSYEIYVSSTNSRPDYNNYEMHFKTENFQIDFVDSVNFFYLSIVPRERLKMSLLIYFSTKQPEKKQNFVLQPKEFIPRKDLIKKSRTRLYKLYHDGMNEDQFNQMKEEIREIRKEKKEKMLLLAGDRDIIEQNKDMAVRYNEMKEDFLKNHSIKRSMKFEKIIGNKTSSDHEKKLKQLYNSVKRDMMILYRAWKYEEDRKAEEKYKFGQKWTTAMAVMILAREIYEKKRAMIALQILTQIKALNARKIQRRVRKVLYRPLLVKDLIEGIVEKEEIKVKGVLSLYHAMNSIALTLKKLKTRKASNIISKMFTDMASPVELMNKFENYFIQVSKIQHKWKHVMSIFKAREQLFMMCWRQYCLSVIESEKKANKLKYTDVIYLIKEQQVLVHARKFILERTKHVQKNQLNVKALLGEKRASEKIESNTDTPTSKKSSLPRTKTPLKLKKDESPTKASTQKGEHTKTKSIDGVLLTNKPKLKFQPSKDELRLIFELIISELLTETPRS